MGEYDKAGLKPGSTILGSTLLLGAMGDPVAQVRAPSVFNALFEALGIDAACVPMHVTPAHLKLAMDGLRTVENLVGLSVTIPHKAAIIPYLDEVRPRARRVGVVNAVRREASGRLIGDIFDGEGFVGGLLARGHAVKGAKAWLVGSGGAGTAIAFALLDHGLAHLTLTDIQPERAATLAARLAEYFPGQVAIGRAESPDLAINATPLGLKPEDPLPFDPRRLPPDTLVVDIIMKPPVTRLLREAAANGRRIHEGCHMLDHQVELYADFLGLRGLPRLAANSA